jgi:phage FluMu protein Com
MAMVIDPTQFCLFKKNAAKLANGHDDKRCPQCKAIRAVVIHVNNETLDMIENVFSRTEPDLHFTAKEVAQQIHNLKTVH